MQNVVSLLWQLLTVNSQNDGCVQCAAIEISLKPAHEWILLKFNVQITLKIRPPKYYFDSTKKCRQFVCAMHRATSSFVQSTKWMRSKAKLQISNLAEWHDAHRPFHLMIKMHGVAAEKPKIVVLQFDRRPCSMTGRVDCGLWMIVRTKTHFVCFLQIRKCIIHLFKCLSLTKKETKNMVV